VFYQHLKNKQQVINGVSNVFWALGASGKATFGFK